jgi:redox-sensitive bicupin YhaK (pirin superfamily)
LEGAGVHLHRAFANEKTRFFDPFLLFDDFRANKPEQYIKGFPWHPHRGIETITYVLKGDVEHGDSLGNKGDIKGGDVQWMTAGSGIIHQEMPKGDSDGIMEGFQLWANLPKNDKMMGPRYRDIAAEQIPLLRQDDGAEIKVICGQVDGVSGPVTDVKIDPEYLDVWVPTNKKFTHRTNQYHTVFCYIYFGEGIFEEGGSEAFGDKHLVLFDSGQKVDITAKDGGLRFLLISGKPLKEPIAWGGPIVMNTEEELQLAFAELKNGNFIKHL